MRMNIKKRTIGIGIVVGLLVFGWWFKGFLYINWNFHLFSLDSWKYLMNEIHQGWRLSNKADWIFFISFVLIGPAFFGLWYWANKVHWRHTMKRGVRGVKTVGKKVVAMGSKKQVLYPMVKPVPEQQKKAMARPVKMTSLGGVSPLYNTAPKTQPFTPQSTPVASGWSAPVPDTTQPVMRPPESPSSYPTDQPYYHGDEAFNEIAETPLSEVQLPQVEAVNEDIASLLSTAGYRAFEGAFLGEQKVDWLGLCKDKIWVAIYDDETGDWLADEEAFNDEDPLWFSETDHRVSPVFMLQQLKKLLLAQFKEKNLTLEVQPVLIERRGNLINAEDMLKTWNDLKVIVCRTEVGGPVELPTVAEVLKEKQEPMLADQLELMKQLFNLGEK